MKNAPLPCTYQASMLHIDCHDIVFEYADSLNIAFKQSLSPKEVLRLSKPENLVEMLSVIRALPKFESLKDKAQKLIDRRVEAYMKSTINSNPGCHSTQ